MSLNVYFFIEYKIGEPWDPYPFILLNLVLSCLAAIQAPIILMSQNRTAQRDRLKAEFDYRINKKAILLIVRIVIGISLITFLIKTQLKDLQSIIEILKSSNKILLILSLSTHVFGVWITAFRWRVLLNTQKVKLSTATLSVTVLIGTFFNNFLVYSNKLWYKIPAYSET